MNDKSLDGFLNVDEPLRDLFNYDSLAHAETITGESYKDSKETSYLGLELLQLNSIKKAIALKKYNDTNSLKQTTEEWLDVVFSMGFKIVYKKAMKGTKDTHYILWNAERGMLLNMDTYNNESVNGATAYFNYCGDRSGMFKCSNGFAAYLDGKDVWEGSVDARDGFRYAVSEMEKKGILLSTWVKQPFIWLLNYQDTKDKNYDYKNINADRIKELPVSVIAAISSTPEKEKIVEDSWVKVKTEWAKRDAEILLKNKENSDV